MTGTTILTIMAKRKILSTQALVTAAVAIAAVIIFNLTRPPLASDMLVAFSTWYKTTSPILEQSDPLALSELKLNVTIELSDSSSSPSAVTWNLPARSLNDNIDRSNTARALQLINESGVFGLPSITNPAKMGSFLSISVRNNERVFETTIPTLEVERNIQLQNLLKLLDIFSNSTQALAIDPART